LAKSESHSIGTFISKAISKLRFDPITEKERRHAWLTILRDLIDCGVDENFSEVKNINETILSLETLGIDHLNEDYLKEEKLYPIIKNIINQILDSVLKNPEILDLIEEADLIEDILGSITRKYFPWMKLFPLFSNEVIGILPDLKEPLFTAFYELDIEVHKKIVKLTEKVFHLFYENEIRKKFKKKLSNNIKGETLLLPLIDSAVNHLPSEKCMTVLICILCTPKREIKQGRIISILLQELGGIYVKLTQVLSELAPPLLAKELKINQDKIGGIFGSEKKSWEYVQEILNRPSLKNLKDYILIPDQIQRAYAGASVGALYEFSLTPLGKTYFQIDQNILIKIQRPGLRKLFDEQKNVLISLLERLDDNLTNEKLNNKDHKKIKGIINTLKRSITHYASQTIEELDFTNEKKNSEIIRAALKEKFNLEIPVYFHVENDVIIMGKLAGEKITSVVQGRYLQRAMIADSLSDAYLYLMLQKGIIWADPHAGNILYDPQEHKLKLIDLNPCFILENKTIKTFINFIYRLILKDFNGILKNLNHLVENPEILKDEDNHKIIKKFFQKENEISFQNFLSEFIRILGQININLKTEIQSTLRGISQIYLTAGAISSRNNFGKIFHKQLNWKIHFSHLRSIGTLHVLRASISLTYNLLKASIDEEVGPSIDERDISVLEKTIVHLNKKNVCQIKIKRINPDENTQLRLLTDGSRLIRSASLKIEILNGSRPASVGYVIEVPEKEWLKERQEFIKLHGLGFVLCLVESLEQLRRNSLEDYWYVIEAWCKRSTNRSTNEKIHIGELKVAARKLFNKRFHDIWKSEFMNITFKNIYLWKILLIFENKIEKHESFFMNFRQGMKEDNKNNQFNVGTFFKCKIMIYRGIVFGIKSLIKKSRFEMNLLPITSNQLVQRMICGLVRKEVLEKIKRY
jgi:predicted unusual protein kinase regulating ubiquinone biosynthesis (AarF/ABC1/UbiB family)